MGLTVQCGRQTCHKSDNPECAGSDWGPLGAAGGGGGLVQLEGRESFLKEEVSELHLQMQTGVCALCSGLSHVSLWSVRGAFGGK